MIKNGSYQHGVIRGLSAGIVLGLSLAVLIAWRIGDYVPYFVALICAVWVNLIVQFALGRLPQNAGQTTLN